MIQIDVATGKKYTVTIGSGLLCGMGEALRALVFPCKAMIVGDSNVMPLYGNMVKSSLADAGFSPFELVFPAGEQSKRLATLENILEALASEHFTRSDIIIALGGGVTGDISGLSAALYARGIKYVQVPTTLLAAVDSSVGGKTAVDLAGGKNLCGAFYQPISVICDTDTLLTLPNTEIKNGLAEMVKYGILSGESLLSRIVNYKNESIDELIAECVKIKCGVVSEDEFDNGKRKLLNLGHTVGHAVEALSDFSIPHGLAVSMGIGTIARAADNIGFSLNGVKERIIDSLMRLDLPYKCDYSIDCISPLIASDKKATGSKISVIVPIGIGDCRICDMSLQEAAEFIKKGL